jgi:hypothetical protein
MYGQKQQSRRKMLGVFAREIARHAECWVKSLSEGKQRNCQPAQILFVFDALLEQNWKYPRDD